MRQKSNVLLQFAESSWLVEKGGCGRANGLPRASSSLLGQGLEDRMNVPVGALSGGQRQVLTLVIATLTPVDVLLLDEHTAALDPKTAEQTMVLTDRIVREKKLTTLMVTHNLRFAEQYGTRLCMFDKGRVVLDAAGDAKRAQKVDDLLAMFNAISIECGN